jgi:hypothetical protein
MKSFFDKDLVVTVNKELGIVNLSIKVSDTQVEIHKLSLNEFIQMVADFNSQLADE